MSRNGNGTYNLPAGNPVVTGTTISSTWANNTLADMANAITGSIAADGQTPITGALKGTNGTVSFAGVGQTKIPSGTTAQRAASPTDGMIRYNTDLKQYEGYKDGAWSIFGNGAGGTLFSDTVTATQGQTVIVLTTGYVLGGDNLSVYVNGSRQIYNVNYTETSTTSFTFTTGLNAGDLVNYTIGASTSLSVNATSVLYNEGGTGAVDQNVESKLQESVSVKDFGAVGNGTTDDTAAIQLALSSGATRIYFPTGTYKILLTEGSYLHKFTSGDIELFGNATILDTSTYTLNGPFTEIFWFDGVSSASVTGINYLGPVVSSPTTQVGYLGAIFVRATTGSTNITVNAQIENARYGVQSGEYATPALGYCSNFDLTLDCLLVGYPLATYLANNINANINAEKTHRAAYVAGGKNVNIDAQFKNQYIADVQVLLTDAMTGTGTSVGCSDCTVRAIDLGSTIFTANSYCAGLNLSRVDPYTYFKNISFNIYVNASDTVASTIGGVIISGTGTGYPNDWIQTVGLTNISISGVIDRSGQTITEHGVGEIYVYTESTNPAYYGTVRELNVSNFTYLPGSGSKPRGFWFVMPGLTGQANFNNSYFGTATPFLYLTNSTSSTLVSNCTLQGTSNVLNGADPNSSKICFVGSTISNQNYTPTDSYKSFLNTSIQGAGSVVKTLSKEIALVGALPTWTGALPNNSIILGVSGYLTQSITGATGMLIGVTGNTTRFLDTNTTTAGLSFSVSNGTDTTPQIQVGTGNIIITPKVVTIPPTAVFTGGSLRLVVSYITINAPTS
jgi:hypothetical protein